MGNNNNNNGAKDKASNDSNIFPQQPATAVAADFSCDSSSSPLRHHDDYDDDNVQARAWELYSGVGLAPMVRASTTPLRALAIKYGADFCYTEELVDRSLIESIRCRPYEKRGWVDYVKDVNKMSNKTRKKLRRLMQEQRQACGGGSDGGGGGANKEGEAGDESSSTSSSMIAPLLLRIDNQLERNKIICQIGTGEPELALKAAIHVHADVSAIDVNMGCPKKFSVSGGMGSALLSDPDRACRIVRTLSRELNPLGKPVSAKIRLLKDTSSTLDFIAALIGAGANAIAIHGRRVGHDAIQPADRDTLKEVVNLAATKYKSQQIPILINGDFYTRNDFTSFIEETGARGVLLARPALHNTSIFRKPPPATTTSSSSMNNTTLYGYDSPLLLDKTKVIQEYLKEAVLYNAHYRNIKYVVCEMMTHRRTPTNLVPHMPIDVFEGGQTIGQVCNCKSLRDICRVWDVDYDAVQKLGTRTIVPSSSSSSSAQPEEAAPAGEHRYSDSYFLNSGCKQQPNSTCSPTMNGQQQRQLQEATTTVPGDCNLSLSSSLASHQGGVLIIDGANLQSSPVHKKPRVEC